MSEQNEDRPLPHWIDDEEWPEILHEAHEEYGRLDEAMRELFESYQDIKEAGLLTPDLAEKIYHLFDVFLSRIYQDQRKLVNDEAKKAKRE